MGVLLAKIRKNGYFQVPQRKNDRLTGEREKKMSFFSVTKYTVTSGSVSMDMFRPADVVALDCARKEMQPGLFLATHPIDVELFSNIWAVNQKKPFFPDSSGSPAVWYRRDSTSGLGRLIREGESFVISRGDKLAEVVPSQQDDLIGYYFSQDAYGLMNGLSRLSGRTVWDTSFSLPCVSLFRTMMFNLSVDFGIPGYEKAPFYWVTEGSDIVAWSSEDNSTWHAHNDPHTMILPAIAVEKINGQYYCKELE